MTLQVQKGEGAQSLDLMELIELLSGFGVRTSVGGGCKVTAASGMNVDVADGEIIHDGNVVSVSAQSGVSIPSADGTYPRKDIVYLDSNGSAQVSKGTAAEALPSGKTKRESYQPAPNDLTGTDAVVLAEVWVAANTTNIQSGDISDRRLSAEVNLTDAVIDALDVSGSETVRDDVRLYLGSGDDDFSLRYDSSAGEVVVEDETNGTELARFQKDDVAKFLTGALVASDEKLYLGSSKEFSVSHDSTSGEWVLADEGTGDEVRFSSGDITTDGDVSVGGNLSVSGLITQATVDDDTRVFLGAGDDDFSLRYDSTAGELVLEDEANGVELARFQKNDVAKVLAGALVADDEKLYFGDGKDYSVRYDSGTNQVIVEDEGTGNQVLFQTDGDLEIDGDLRVGGSFDPTDLTPDSVVINNELKVPIYADNANAVAEDAEVWFNDGSGPQSAGLYYYDGGVQGPLDSGSGSAPGSLSGLNIDTDKGWSEYVLTGVGHNSVRVPQVRNLTVDDFESGAVSSVYQGMTADFSVQSSTVKEGSYALKCDTTSGSTAQLGTQGGLAAFPQAGDAFSYYGYMTDADDILITDFATQDTPSSGGEPANAYKIRLTQGSVSFYERKGANQTQLASDTFGSNYLNEWLEIDVEWDDDGNFTIRVLDSNGTRIGSLTATNSTYDAGGVSFVLYNGTVNPVGYWDDFTVERREPKAAGQTERGVTEAGNELAPSGGVDAGPHEAPVNALRAVHAFAPVTDGATQGDAAEYVDLDVAGDPAVVSKYTHDGQGAAYAHRREMALGRIARLNANLAWEYDTLSDVPNWSSADGGTSTWTFNVNSRPRRIHVEHDGSGGSDDFGGVVSSVLTEYDSLGAFRITFRDVSFTNNADDNTFVVGITDQTPDTRVDNAGNGIFYLDTFSGSSDDQVKVVSGGSATVSTFSDIDWSSKHDVTLEYDGSEARLYVDGVEKGVVSSTTSGDFSPVVQLKEEANSGSAETVEVEQVIVEAIA